MGYASQAMNDTNTMTKVTYYATPITCGPSIGLQFADECDDDKYNEKANGTHKRNGNESISKKALPKFT